MGVVKFLFFCCSVLRKNKEKKVIWFFWFDCFDYFVVYCDYEWIEIVKIKFESGVFEIKYILIFLMYVI